MMNKHRYICLNTECSHTWMEDHVDQDQFCSVCGYGVVCLSDEVIALFEEYRLDWIGDNPGIPLDLT